MDKLQKMARYRPASWRERAPRRNDGDLDHGEALGLAASTFEKLVEIDQQVSEQIKNAAKTFTPQGLAAAIPELGRKIRTDLEQIGSGPVAQVERRRDTLLAGMKPEAPGLDPIVAELRGREIRELLREMVPDEAQINVTGDGAKRWIAGQYEEALANGDLLTAYALETVPAVYPEHLRLTDAEREAVAIERAAIQYPDVAATVRDLDEALSDIAATAALVDGALTNAEKEARRNAPAAPERDPGIQIGGETFHGVYDDRGNLHVVTSPAA